VIKEQKALLRDKSKLKIRPSLHLSPLLCPFETRSFSLAADDPSCATSCITGRQWKCVLLLSESDKIPKVVLLIAKTDQAWEIKEQTALLRDKS